MIYDEKWFAAYFNDVGYFEYNEFTEVRWMATVAYWMKIIYCSFTDAHKRTGLNR